MDDVNIIEEDKSSLLRSVKKHADRISSLRSKQEIKVHINLTDDSIREGEKCTNRKTDAKMQSRSSDKFINTTAKKHLKEVKNNKTNLSDRVHRVVLSQKEQCRWCSNRHASNEPCGLKFEPCDESEIKIDKHKLSLFGVKNDKVTELIKIHIGGEVIKPEFKVDKNKLRLFGLKNNKVTELIMQARTAITSGTVQDSKDSKIDPMIDEKHDKAGSDNEFMNEKYNEVNDADEKQNQEILVEKDEMFKLMYNKEEPSSILKSEMSEEEDIKKKKMMECTKKMCQILKLRSTTK